jgi:hypothetical protein
MAMPRPNAALVVADKYERKLELSLLRVFRELQDEANVTAFEAAMKRHNMNDALHALGIDRLEQKLIG